MGREAQGDIKFGGQVGPGRILLEAEGLILRGAVRGRIDRSEVRGASVEGDDLVIDTANGPLRAGLGALEAARWVAALARPLPSLAAKLGLAPDRPAYLLTPIRDEALLAALEGHTTEDPDRAAILLAEVEDPRTFAALLPGLGARPVWIVTIKGRDTPLSDDSLRPLLRERGFVDSKSCAVSARRTATRYARKRATPQAGGVQGA